MNASLRPRVNPEPASVTEVAGRGVNGPSWMAYSEHTGLITRGDTAAIALDRYQAALPERRPLDFAWDQEPAPSAPAPLDFSVFHPLDHWVGSAYCRSFYGGFRRHLSLWWDYQAELLRPSNAIARIACLIGRHRPVDYWMRSPESGRFLNAGASCASCAVTIARTWSHPRPRSMRAQP
jgi:hypothetical protein